MLPHLWSSHHWLAQILMCFPYSVSSSNALEQANSHLYMGKLRLSNFSNLHKVTLEVSSEARIRTKNSSFRWVKFDFSTYLYSNIHPQYVPRIYLSTAPALSSEITHSSFFLLSIFLQSFWSQKAEAVRNRDTSRLNINSREIWSWMWPRFCLLSSKDSLASGIVFSCCKYLEVMETGESLRERWWLTLLLRMTQTLHKYWVTTGEEIGGWIWLTDCYS
jgi:hypothetical protein